MYHTLMKLSKVELTVGYIQGGMSLNEAVSKAYSCKGKRLQEQIEKVTADPDYQMLIKTTSLNQPDGNTALDRTQSGRRFTRQDRLEIVSDIAFNGEKDSDRLKAVDLANKMDVQEVEASALELAMMKLLDDQVDFTIDGGDSQGEYIDIDSELEFE